MSNLIMMGKINGHDQKQNERVLLSAGRTSRAMPFAVMRKERCGPPCADASETRLRASQAMGRDQYE